MAAQKTKAWPRIVHWHTLHYNMCTPLVYRVVSVHWNVVIINSNMNTEYLRVEGLLDHFQNDTPGWHLKNNLARSPAPRASIRSCKIKMTRPRVILKNRHLVNDKFSPLRHHFQNDTPACHFEEVTADAFSESEERTPVGTPQIPFEQLANASVAALSLVFTYCDCAMLSFSLLLIPQVRPARKYSISPCEMIHLPREIAQ
jgi:hypothetical protein